MCACACGVQGWERESSPSGEIKSGGEGGNEKSWGGHFLEAANFRLSKPRVMKSNLPLPPPPFGVLVLKEGEGVPLKVSHVYTASWDGGNVKTLTG